jgi:hypothetical protein
MEKWLLIYTVSETRVPQKWRNKCLELYSFIINYFLFEWNLTLFSIVLNAYAMHKYANMPFFNMHVAIRK